MFNYIAQYVIGFFVQVKYIDPVSRQSKLISSNSRLTLVDWVVGDLKLDLPLGIMLALITVFIIGFLLDRTKIGYEIKAVGAGSSAAKYAGISVGKRMVLAMIISKGSTYMSSASGINGEIASVITGLILLFGACGVYTRSKLKSMKLFLERSPKNESYHN